jgi:hypothetical protein
MKLEAQILPQADGPDSSPDWLKQFPELAKECLMCDGTGTADFSEDKFNYGPGGDHYTEDRKDICPECDGEGVTFDVCVMCGDAPVANEGESCANCQSAEHESGLGGDTLSTEEIPGTGKIGQFRGASLGDIFNDCLMAFTKAGWDITQNDLGDKMPWQISATPTISKLPPGLMGIDRTYIPEGQYEYEILIGTQKIMGPAGGPAMTPVITAMLQSVDWQNVPVVDENFKTTAPILSQLQSIIRATTGTPEPKCECGSESVGSPYHSDFCPKYVKQAQQVQNITQGVPQQMTPWFQDRCKYCGNQETTWPQASQPSMSGDYHCFVCNKDFAGKTAQQGPTPGGPKPVAPPAAPGGQPPMPMDAPEDMFNDEDEFQMSLGEALEQLEEASKVVVDKVQSGETILHGDEVEPVEGPDTGALPSPAPKIGQVDPSWQKNIISKDPQGSTYIVKGILGKEDIEVEVWIENGPDCDVTWIKTPHINQDELGQLEMDIVEFVCQDLESSRVGQVDPPKPVDPPKEDEQYMPSIVERGSDFFKMKMKELTDKLREKKDREQKGLPPVPQMPEMQKKTPDMGVYTRKPGQEKQPVLPQESTSPGTPEEVKYKKKWTDLPVAEQTPNKYKQLEEQHGPEVKDLLLLVDTAKDLASRERKSAPSSFYDDEWAKDLNNFLGADTNKFVKNIPGTNKPLYTKYDTNTYKRALPAELENRLRAVGGDWTKLEEEELREAVGAMQHLYEADKGARQKLMHMVTKSKDDPGRGADPVPPKGQKPIKTMPHTKSKQELRDLLNTSVEKWKKQRGSSVAEIDKESVDQEAKDYWEKLFGDYGVDMTKNVDRLASVTDMVEDIFAQHGIELDTTMFNTVVAFILEDSDDASLCTAVSKLASVDDEFANLVDRIMINHLAKTSPSHLSPSVKSAMFVVAMHDSGQEDNIMTYIAEKMKTPKPKGQSDDAFKVEKMKDEADKSETGDHTYNPEFEIDDCFIKDIYTHLVIKWDTSDDNMDKSDEAIKQSIISFCKSLESDKEFIDLGFCGQFNFVDDEFDADAGVAEVYFRSNKPSDAVKVMRTE